MKITMAITLCTIHFCPKELCRNFCSCGLDIEPTAHFLLHCPEFVNKICTLLSTMGNITYKLLGNTESVLTQTLLFGNASFNINDDTQILITTINFLLLTKIFDEPIFKQSLIILCVGYGNYFSLFCLDHNDYLEY